MPRRRGKRGNGGITERVMADGRIKYQAQWSVTEAGKRVRKSETFIIRSDADWWLAQAKRGDAPNVDLTVGEYLDRWLLDVQHEVKPSTWISYSGHVHGYLKREVGGYRLVELQPRHVNAARDRLLKTMSRRKRPLSPTTVRLILTTLGIALEGARERHEVQENAVSAATLPRPAEYRIEPLTDEEAQRVVDAATGTWLEPLVRFLLGSGVRLGEAVSLNQGDVKLDEGYVQLETSKRRIRAVQVSDDGIEGLRLAIAGAPRVGKDEPVFFGKRTGDRLKGWSVSHAFPRLLEAAGVSRMTPHGLRHGHATLSRAHGRPMHDIADQLGHADSAFTHKRYAHVAPSRQREGVRVLDEALKRR